MFCQACGKKLPDSSKFCNHCGTQINIQSYSSGLEGKQKTVGKAAVSTRLIGVVAVIIITVLLAIGTLSYILLNHSKEKQNTSDQSESQQSQAASAPTQSASSETQEIPIQQDEPEREPEPQHNTGHKSLVPEAFSVPSGQRWYVKFDVLDTWKDIIISGSFRSSGGSGNDIEVFIADEEGFLNIVNGHEAQVYYQSGRVTAGSINISLEPGTYYLIFSNTFSGLANKTVAAEIDLEYQY